MVAVACNSGAIDSPGGSGLPGPNTTTGPGTTPGGLISATNVAHLRQVARDEPAAGQILKEGNIRGVRWQHDSSRALLHTRTGVYELKNQDGAPNATHLKVHVGERILDLWPTGGASNSGIYVTLTDSTTYNIRDLAGDGLKTLTSPGPISSAVVVLDGAQVALSRLDKVVVNVVGISEGNAAGELSGFQASTPIFSISATPDGKSLVWQSRGIVQTMGIAGSGQGARITHEESVSELAASHDSSLLATATGSTVTLWEAASGGKRTSLRHKAAVLDIDFSADGSLLAVATEDAMTVWELSSGREVASFTGEYRFVAFSPDLKTLLTVDGKGIATLWRP